jgi:hypothetical protein
MSGRKKSLVVFYCLPATTHAANQSPDHHADGNNGEPQTERFLRDPESVLERLADHISEIRLSAGGIWHVLSRAHLQLW